MRTDSIIYEQPINELVRVALRLEHLFAQLDLHIAQEPSFNTSDVVRIVIEILNVLDRPDLKSKLTQEFQRLIVSFNRLPASPHLSQSKLNKTLDELKKLLDPLLKIQGKIAQSLRDNEFIANIRLHLLTPGGDSSFETPSYHYWLQQPQAEHAAILSNWIQEFDVTRSAIKLLLSIIRTSTEPVSEIAENGFFHRILSTQIPGQLIRVWLPKSLVLYPEISVGKHRLNIRFATPSLTERPKQAEELVKFELSICQI